MTMKISEQLREAAKLSKHQDQVLRGLKGMPGRQVSWDPSPERKRTKDKGLRPAFRTIRIRDPDGSGWLKVRVDTLKTLAKQGLIKQEGRNGVFLWTAPPD